MKEREREREREYIFRVEFFQPHTDFRQSREKYITQVVKMLGLVNTEHCSQHASCETSRSQGLWNKKNNKTKMLQLDCLSIQEMIALLLVVVCCIFLMQSHAEAQKPNKFINPLSAYDVISSHVVAIMQWSGLNTSCCSSGLT